MSHNHFRLVPLAGAAVLGVLALLVVLNLPVSAQPATPTPVPLGLTTPVTYTVRPGDSWTSVARRLGVGMRALQEANPDSVRPSGWLIVGEVLTAPGAAEATATPEATQPPPAATATPESAAPTAAPVTATLEAAGAPQTYKVRPGESWSSIAARFGVSLRALQAANPAAVRPSGWLIVGEELIIPGAGGATVTPAATATLSATLSATVAAATSEATATPETAAIPVAPGSTGTYIVQAGESWNSIAAKLGISAQALQDANPQAIRPGLVLFRNEELVIPGGAPQPEATAEATPEATEGITVTATAATPPESTEEAAGAAEAAAPATTGCPGSLAEYPDRLVEILAAPEATFDAVLDFLRTCEAIDEESVRLGDWTGDGVEDLALVLVDPASDTAQPVTDLLLFSGGSPATLAYRARAAGEVRILATEDVNGDGTNDLVWVDTTCGASTCFDTVQVRSWDGSTWRDWTDGTITMAYAEVTLDDIRDTPGQEIELVGGVYGSVGAGPQRARTEVWGSVDSAPYRLLDKVYERSDCLYFKVLDADEALDRYQELGLAQAREMYTEAVTNDALAKCWQHTEEIDELRSFSLFRLALIHAYEGNPDAAAESANQLQQLYPESLYSQLGQAWLASYLSTGNMATACAAATQFATDNPATYETLSDYGYANPTFTAADLCPVLDIQPAAVPSTTTEPAPAVTATEVITPEAVLTATTESLLTPPAVPGQVGELPQCPTTLEAYATLLPGVIAVSGADPLIVETWLRLCDGMTDDRGGMMLDDFNGDGVLDALFLPTIISDLGFGPGGAQGAVLLYHGKAEGGYDLVYNPEVFGQPTLLAVGDVNGDDRIDLAWAIDGCANDFCVKEVQGISWNPESGAYESIVEPGANIAEGTARFEELPAGAPGQGQQLVLEGGVSGTPEGGLEVPHTELWQSIGGQPFRRLSWTYDRAAPGSDCAGLRLVEADMALQAADVLGYGPAADLYQQALDPALRACSIFGVPATEELTLLQGLASFRLLQTQALSGTVEAAQTTLAALTQGQPDGSFTEAATQWLDNYESTGDAAAACQAIQPIFDRETLAWQITDHFGYNHPALAPEQICFVPPAE
jgi:LysM repeat protein